MKKFQIWENSWFKSFTKINILIYILTLVYIISLLDSAECMSGKDNTVRVIRDTADNIVIHKLIVENSKLLKSFSWLSGKFCVQFSDDTSQFFTRAPKFNNCDNIFIGKTTLLGYNEYQYMTNSRIWIHFPDVHIIVPNQEVFCIDSYLKEGIERTVTPPTIKTFILNIKKLN
jgi:hypothetical protein